MVTSSASTQMICKYAVGPIVIPAFNSSSIPAELENLEALSQRTNQSLILAKTAELMVSLKWTRHLFLPTPSL